MIIKTLNLYAFGKFENTTIELSDGFNLIYGPNEAGKSTIQAFIEGMFFGFYKPYRKRRTYSDDYKRYKPLHQDKYYGSMIVIDDNNREIRIERDFLQDRDGVRIFDNLTGEDITMAYPYDAATKQYLPLGYNGVNASIYNNTVNFKQMASYSDEMLAKEVNNRLIDMASSQGGAADIPVSGVIDYLEEKKKEIGTFRRSRSNYGLAVRKREQLEEQLTAAEQSDERIRANQKRILQYQSNLARYEKKKQDRIEQRREQERAAVDAQNRRVAAARAEGDKLRAERQEIAQAGDYYDEATHDHLRYLNRTGESLERQKAAVADDIRDLKAGAKKTRQQYDKLTEQLSLYDKRQIDADIISYRDAVGSAQPKTAARAGKDSAREADTGLRATFKSYGRATYIVMLVIGLALAAVGFVNPAQYFVFVAQVVLLAAGLFLAVCGIGGNILLSRGGSAPAEAAYDDAEIYDDDADDDLSQNVDLLYEDVHDDEDAPATIEDLLYVYGVTDVDTLGSMLTRIKSAFDKQKRLAQRLSDSRVKLESLKRQQADLDRQMTEMAIGIKNILEPLGLTSIEAYAEGAKAKEALKDLDAKIAANDTLVDNMAGADYAKMPSGRLLQRSSHDVSERTLDRSIETIRHEIAALEGQNQTLASGHESPVTLRERIAALDRQIQAYEDDMKAIDMAEAFFNRYQKRSHQMQAGDLNEKIGEILSQITHRYHEVRVDDHLNVKVVSPSTGTLVGINQLSGGTVDQIYFALRFGVRDLLDVHQSLPFVLDDPFVQYDDTRKKAALTFLNEMSQTDQILLFTCSSDEKRIMDKEGMHYIGLALV